MVDVEFMLELISDYMDGPRSISSDNISLLIISEPNPQIEGDEGEYDLLMCAPHYLGDGASLHQCTHDLLTLLASSMTNSELEGEILSHPLSVWTVCSIYFSRLTRNVQLDHLPLALEDRLSIPNNRWAKAASDVNLIKTLQKEIVRPFLEFLSIIIN